ncbi:MAG: sigma-70 family RNA polymerase sigma factor [Cryobacterium sp.]|nr:sigma-70 family RNA polymerase sigma factor [Oligoflexia bacterium]
MRNPLMTPNTRDELSLETRLKGLFLSGIGGNESEYAAFLELAAKIVRSNLRKTIPASLSHSRDLLEDIVQDVLLALHRKRHTYRTEHPFLPWMFAVAKHRWIDVARMMAVRPELIGWTESDWERIPDLEALEKIERQDEELTAKDALLDRMAILTDQQKELIRLAKLEELPLAEVAKRLQLNLSAVKVGIHRAMKKLTLSTEKEKT